jgi:hypothetical protein
LRHEQQGGMQGVAEGGDCGAQSGDGGSARSEQLVWEHAARSRAVRRWEREAAEQQPQLSGVSTRRAGARRGRRDGGGGRAAYYS